MRTLTKIVCLAGGSLLLLRAGPASAQQAWRLQGQLGLELITSAIESDAAEQAGTGSRLWGAQLNLGVTALRVLTATVDLGIVGVKDERPFTENTTAGEQTSGVAAGMGTLAVGLRTPPLTLAKEGPVAVAAGVNVGRTWFDMNRDITNCIDCTSEDVEIRAGEFWESGLHVTRGRSGLSARYRVYRDRSDLRDALMIGLNRSF